VNRDALSDYFESVLAASSVSNQDSGSGAGTTLSPTTMRQLVRVKQQGTRYHMIGVFGGQSSGKSTLLNELFHTRFQTMDEETGRQQTTKGAFLATYSDASTEKQSEAVSDVNSSSSPTSQSVASVAAGEKVNKSSSLFVMDFEGTDGMERGEDQSFERQLSLFALSVADVLLINMWANDVGRYNAANMSLLRTIFEVNLQLFAHASYAHDEKPTLLIVLRDFTETDLQKYSDIVMKSLTKIWDSITKPVGFEFSSITTLFHVRFHGLPHYKLQREQFDAAVVDFRRWFLDPISSKYLFDRTVSFRGIPLESLPSYFESCWSSIQSSRDLDIPSQRDLIARHRCTELFDAATQSFRELVEARLQRVRAGDIAIQLESTLTETIDGLLTDFADQTRLYAKRVVMEYTSKLQRELEDLRSNLVQAQTTKVAEEALRLMDDDIQMIVDDAMKQLLGTKDILTGKASAQQSKKYVRKFWDDIFEGAQSLEDRLANGSDVSCYGRFAKVMEVDSVARERVVGSLKESIRQKLRSRVSSMASDACSTMSKAFDYVLTHKEDGTVRFFSTTTGLESAFPSARLAGLIVLNCIFYVRLATDGDNDDEALFYLHLPTYEDGDNQVRYPDLSGSRSTSALSPSRSITSKQQQQAQHEEEEEEEEDTHDEGASSRHSATQRDDVSEVLPAATAAVGFTCIAPEDILMTKSAVRRAFDLYTQQIQFSMQMQMRTIESSQQNIPVWVWIAMLVLGHNEFMFVLTSPVLLLFIILMAYFFFSAWIVAQWHRFEETGPKGMVLAIQAGIAFVRPYVKHLQEHTGGSASTDPAEVSKKRE